MLIVRVISHLQYILIYNLFRHSKYCRKVFKQKRKVYDSAKHRAEGTELQQYLAQQRRNGGGAGLRSSSIMSSNRASMTTGRSSVGGSKGGLPKWKAESLSFRNAIRQAKLVSQAEQRSKVTGIPLHALLPVTSRQNIPDAIQSTYIRCPHCDRSFNEKAAERHIPKVRSTVVVLYV
jgi:hypothetical protein